MEKITEIFVGLCHMGESQTVDRTCACTRHDFQGNKFGTNRINWHVVLAHDMYLTATRLIYKCCTFFLHKK
jgi:hypothetical protein